MTHPKARAFLVFSLLALPASAAPRNVCSRPPAPAPSKLPTGNGFGYGVVAADGAVTTLLAHPYTRVRPRPKDAQAGDDDEDEEEAVLADNYLNSARWSLGGKDRGGKAEYLDQSQVVRTKGGGIQQDAFQPNGLSHNALVLTGTAEAGQGAIPSLDVRWGHPVKKESTQVVNGVSVRVFELAGVKRPLVAIPLSPKPGNPDAKECPGREEASARSCLSGSTGWALVSLPGTEALGKVVADVKAWQGGANPLALGAREAAEADRARPKAAACFTSTEEKRLFRQNETILRMAQIRESASDKQHSEGMINASLPEGEFAVPYVRDMAYAAVSLSDTGHTREAEKAILSYFHAQPIGVNQKAARGLPYQISTTRYFGNGAEEADRSGNAEPNLEFDDWGLALWAMGQHYQATRDTAWLSTPTYRGSAYESARDYVVTPLLGNLDPTPNDGLIVAKDSSVWEQNDEPRRHNAASTIAAIGGLKSFLPVAEAMHDEKTAAEIRENLRKLSLGFQDAFVRNGDVLGAARDEPSQVKDSRGRPVPHRNDIDGALLEAINMGVIEDRAQAENIVSRMERELKAPTGGYRRTNGPTGYERQEFVFMSINLARAYLRLGQPAKAEAIMKRVQELAAKDHDMIPELYQAECMPGEPDFQKQKGSPAGAIPMVGYGAGAYNLYLHERQTLLTKGPSALSGGYEGGDAAAISQLRGACSGNPGARGRTDEPPGEHGAGSAR